ncbi:MAG TPA: EAL domain-containing protein [Xanthomonadaceae bacterium]|nr:EAL domain-containing protein [Xanthomonadaceae bacterium]
MPTQEAVIRLLIIEDRMEDAEQIVSILRNGGMAVRPNRPETGEEMEAMLGEQALDLVVAALDAKAVPFGEVMQAVNASGKDLPVVAVLGKLETKKVMAALASGARDIALRGEPEHVQFVIRNEFSTLAQRRQVRRLEAALRETERRCDSLIASSRDPIAYVHEGMHIRANEAYLEIFGYDTFEDIEGLPVLDMVAGKDADGFKTLLKRLSKGEPPPRTLELHAQRADGSTFDAVMEFAQASYEGEPCLQIVFRQQVLDPDMVAELDALRSRDQVTGLFNRTHFMGELERTVAAAAGGRDNQALLLVEMDNYASLLNDVGLGNADGMLRAAAGSISSSVPEDAVSARFTDHSFGVICHCDHRQTHALAETIRDAFKKHIVEVGDRSLTLSVSIGGVQIGEKIASVQQVLGKASQCLQTALNDGGNQIQIFDPAARDRAEEERVAQWIKRIQTALKTGDFVLHFQPIISLQGDELENYEVLLRMRLAGGEIVPPLTFLPIAEEHGLMDDIDRWVIGRAIAMLSERRKAGHNTRLFVKITPYSLQNESLAGWIGEQVAKAGIDGAHLVMEIPEAKVFTNLKAAQEFQQAIATFECGFCLEQFGSGVNSFQMLEHIHASYLKIDRSFMDELGKNAENQKKVREIAEKAAAAGVRTIAEFVQDAASMTVLFTCSVDYVEGNFLAPASPDMTYDFG